MKTLRSFLFSLVLFLVIAAHGWGADVIATGQVALSTSAASVVAANSSRHAVTVKNIDASISIYVGVAGVTSSTGYLLKAGESVRIQTGAAVFAVAASGTPVVVFVSESN